jgi:hypothetical protein
MAPAPSNAIKPNSCASLRGLGLLSIVPYYDEYIVCHSFRVVSVMQCKHRLFIRINGVPEPVENADTARICGMLLHSVNATVLLATLPPPPSPILPLMVIRLLLLLLGLLLIAAMRPRTCVLLNVL